MESIDFTGLAARAVAGLHEVRACLLVSRDGLTLAALPQGGEDVARRALGRLESVGQPERGFLVVGDEVWVVSRRGPYLGIVVAEATAKAGLLLDRLESTLRAAEEARLLAGSAGQGRPEISRRPRTPLHREPRFDPTRSQSRPPNVFEEMARVVSVPDREEAQRSEPSVGEASVSTAWPQRIREPEAPNVGGPGSGSEPPSIVRPEPRPEAPEPAAEEPEVVAPEEEEPETVTPEPEEEEPETVTPEPEEEEPETVTPEEEAEKEAFTPEPTAEEPEIVALEEEEPDVAMAADAEAPSFLPAETHAAESESTLATPMAEVESDAAAAASAEPAAATPDLETEEPRFVTPIPDFSPLKGELAVPEPETVTPALEAERKTDDHVESEPAAAAAEEDSIPEALGPDIQTQLQELELSAAEEESGPETPAVEAVGAAETSTPPADVSTPPIPRFAHPQIESPKATPHYSPPEALLGEMGRVVAEESPPADILPPGVSPVGTAGAPAGAGAKETADPGGPKTPEASKERGDDTEEVDPVALAREFSQLFDEPERNS